MDFEEIKDHFEYNWKSYVMGVVVLLMLVLSIMVINKDKQSELYMNYDNKIEFIEGEGKEIKKYFSLFNQNGVKTKKGDIDYTLDLYLKKPFIKRENLEIKLKTLIELIKTQSQARGENVRSVRILIYDREISYNLMAKPVGEYFYALPFTKIPEEEQLKENRGLTAAEVAYYYTVNGDGKKDYSKNELYGDFRELDSKTGEEPLTDQEYEWFVKYDMYKNLGKGLQTMLEWEYGVTPDNRMGEVEMELSRFLDRVTEIGDYKTLFDDENITKIGKERELAKENPSLLLYMKSGIIDENEVTARAKLKENFPGEYDQAINEWIDEKADKIQEE